MMTGSIPLISATISGLLFAGILLALVRNLQAPLAQHLQTTEKRIDRLQQSFTLALVPMMLVSGLLIDKWGPLSVLVTGSLLAALGVMALEPSRSERSVLPAVLLCAAGLSGLLLGGLVLCPAAFYPNNPFRSVSLGCVFLTAGALLTPPLTRAVERRIGFRAEVLILAFVCLVPAILGVAYLAIEGAGPAGSPADFGEVVTHPVVLFGGLALLLHRILERSLDSWPDRFLVEVGNSPAAVAVWLGLFWGAFLGARLLTATLVRPNSEPSWVLLLAALMTAVVLGNLVGISLKGGASWGVVFTGAFLAPVLPALVSLVLTTFPRGAGLACGLVFALGLGASRLVPPLVDPGRKRHTPRTAMRLALGVALALTLVGLVLVLVQ
jgi:fucose permease